MSADQELHKIYNHFIKYGELDEELLPAWVHQQRNNVLQCQQTGEHVFHPASAGPCLLCKGFVPGGKAEDA